MGSVLFSVNATINKFLWTKNSWFKIFDICRAPVCGLGGELNSPPGRSRCRNTGRGPGRESPGRAGTPKRSAMVRESAISRSGFQRARRLLAIPGLLCQLGSYAAAVWSRSRAGQVAGKGFAKNHDRQTAGCHRIKGARRALIRSAGGYNGGRH